MSEYEVKIRGEYVADDGLSIRLEESAPGTVVMPPCPDCGGDVVCSQAGYVPGTVACVGPPVGTQANGRPIYESENGCGSLLHQAGHWGQQVLTRERFFSS